MNKALFQLAVVHYGKSPNSVRQLDGAYPVYGSSGLVAQANEKLFDGKGIVVARKGTLGNPTYVEGGVWVIDTAYYVDPLPGVNAKWLYYQLQNFDLTKLNEATGVPSIGRDLLYRVEFFTPYEPIQERIAEILSSLDDQIAVTEQLLDKNTSIKKGMMTDLFSRGIDPATGHLRPSFHDAPEFYYHTPLGPVPKGWEYGLLKRFVRVTEYGISTSLNEDVTGIPVLRMNNIQNNRFDVSDLKYTKDPDAYRLKLKKGDVLYNRTNSMDHVGKTALWREELEECSFASYLVRLNLHEEQLRPAYFAHWMSQESSQNAIRVFATPAVQQVNINPTNLQRVEICYPGDPHEQDLIVERIDALDDNIAAESANLMKLQEQKAGLMRDLLTGKVPVSA